MNFFSLWCSIRDNSPNFIYSNLFMITLTHILNIDKARHCLCHQSAMPIYTKREFWCMLSIASILLVQFPHCHPLPHFFSFYATCWLLFRFFFVYLDAEYLVKWADFTLKQSNTCLQKLITNLEWINHSPIGPGFCLKLHF